MKYVIDMPLELEVAIRMQGYDPDSYIDAILIKPLLDFHADWLRRLALEDINLDIQDQVAKVREQVAYSPIVEDPAEPVTGEESVEPEKN